jgi:hypothetical protein
LRAAVQERSTPVRPLLSPAYRTGAVLATGLVVSAVYLVVTGLRADAPGLGPVVVWLPAILRIVAAAGLVLLAAREASPSEGASALFRTAALLSVPLLLLACAEALALAGGGGGGAGPLLCYVKVVALAIPAALLTAWLLSRAYPLRPVFSAVAGIGGGCLIAEAVLHLTCPATSPAHTLGVHGGAVATMAAAGAALGWMRLRSRRRGNL